MSESIEDLVELAKGLATQAGQLIKDRRENGYFSVTMKAVRNPVTDADLAAEKLILSAIRARYPQHLILSEETAPELSAENLRSEQYLWIVDPIDGTVNYSRGHRQVGVSIAVARAGEVQGGVVFAPFDNELFHAIRGRGSFCNGKRLAVHNPATLDRALIATGFPYERSNVEELTARVSRVLQHCQDLRRIGAASLDICWVACGRLDAFYEDVMPWDMAAGALIAREAGARLARFRNGTSAYPEELRGDSLLMAGPELCNSLLSILK